MEPASYQLGLADKRFMPAGTPGADTPPGFASFCLRFADQCKAPAPRAPPTIALTPAVLDKLNAVNSVVNASIWPESDQQHYDRSEYWNIPTDEAGDCEDYALTKRKELLAAGVPQSVLLVAIVLTPQLERCAVLVVVTDRGDLVLDDRRDEVQLWSAEGYIWIERQDPTQQYGWVWLQSVVAGERLLAGGGEPPVTAPTPPRPSVAAIVEPAPWQTGEVPPNPAVGTALTQQPPAPQTLIAAATLRPALD